MACGGMIFAKNLNLFFNFHFFYYSKIFTFPCYYCSIDFKRQSEHSGFCPDTSILVYFGMRLGKTHMLLSHVDLAQ